MNIITSPRGKYQPAPTVSLPDRTWPNKTITAPPIWCAVDLRDGNQSLIEPMGSERKLAMFNLLCEMGYKEIEVGFPAASQTDFDFLRQLIDGNLIPDDVSIQVLTQARHDLISRTFEAIKGAPSSIVHLYNSTSTVQRRVVFNMDMAGIMKLAVDGAKMVREGGEKATGGGRIRYQYSPESFTATELDYALEVCEAVMDVFEPTPENPLILNLPSTVEVATPNVYADRIEWFSRHVKNRASILISLHPHNDRGTGVAAAELGIMAGADRVEGTLFGNGERTGNVDLVTLGLNMYTQGVDPGIDFSDMPRIRSIVEQCNRMGVHERHPYGGDLVFTAFSGSHQDAINKGIKAMRESNQELWEVPYLPIDPLDVGRTYEAVIRVNSQSGKGGVAYIMEQDFDIRMPRSLQVEFSKIIQDIADKTGEEIVPDMIWRSFDAHYLTVEEPYSYIDHKAETVPDNPKLLQVVADVKVHGTHQQISAQGNGPIEAVVNAIKSATGLAMTIEDYEEHTLRPGSDAQAVSFVRASLPNGTTRHGVGVDSNIVTSALKAVLSAANNLSKSLTQN